MLGIWKCVNEIDRKDYCHSNKEQVSYHYFPFKIHCSFLIIKLYFSHLHTNQYLYKLKLLRAKMGQLSVKWLLLHFILKSKIYRYSQPTLVLMIIKGRIRMEKIRTTRLYVFIILCTDRNQRTCDSKLEYDI